MTYFEPGVLAAPDAASARKHLEIFAKYSDTDGGILVDSVRSRPARTSRRRSC